MFSLRPGTNTRNPWFRDYWHKLTGCGHQRPEERFCDQVGIKLWTESINIYSAPIHLLLIPTPGSGIKLLHIGTKKPTLAYNLYLQLCHCCWAVKGEGGKGYVTTSPGSPQLPCSHPLSRQHLTMLTATHVFINICISTANKYLKIFRYLDIFKSSGH